MNYDLPDFINKDVVFIGKNDEAKSFEAFINANGQIKSFQSISINDENLEEYNKQLESLNKEESIVVKSAEFPGRLLTVAYTTPTKVFFQCVQQLGAKTIGVTGSRGKSTVSSMLYRMLQQGGVESVLTGEIGNPKLDLLASASERTVFVLELTSFMLEGLDISPDMAVITNLTRDHIDYHGDLESYWEAKRNIVRYMNSENSVVFNPQTEVIFHWLAETGVKQIPIDPAETVDMSKSQIFGEHNKLNYLMAKAAAQAFGVDLFSCQHILKNFKPLTHRLEKVRVVKGITFIDDAIATDPESTVAAVTACIREVAPVGCLMFGGKDENKDLNEVMKILSTLLIPKLVLFPETGAKLKEILPELYQVEIFETTDMHEAVNWAAEHCPSGSVCLLSTGSKNSSVWKDYLEKGDLYQKAVLGLPT